MERGWQNLGNLELFYIDCNWNALGVELDEKRVLGLKVEVTALEIGWDDDGKGFGIGLVAQFHDHYLTLGFNMALDEGSGNLVAVASETAAVAFEFQKVEFRGVEAVLAVEN